MSTLKEVANLDEMMGYCPFCGSVSMEIVGPDDGDLYYATCLQCYARGPMIKGSAEVAVEKWNTRYSVTKKKVKPIKK